jgi:hypothetical protein
MYDTNQNQNSQQPNQFQNQPQNQWQNNNYFGGMPQQQQMQKTDEYANFQNELQTAPRSQPDNYVYVWNPNTKRYTCYEEPHLFTNKKLDKQVYQHFMTELHKLDRIDPAPRARKAALAASILGFLLAILFLIFALVAKTRGWRVVWWIMFVGALLVGIGGLVYYLSLWKGGHQKELRERRKDIRQFLTTYNKMTFWVRNQHWRPSNNLAYLTYMHNVKKKGFVENFGTNMAQNLNSATNSPADGKNIPNYNANAADQFNNQRNYGDADTSLNQGLVHNGEFGAGAPTNLGPGGLTQSPETRQTHQPQILYKSSAFMNQSKIQKQPAIIQRGLRPAYAGQENTYPLKPSQTSYYPNSTTLATAAPQNLQNRQNRTIVRKVEPLQSYTPNPINNSQNRVLTSSMASVSMPYSPKATRVYSPPKGAKPIILRAGEQFSLAGGSPRVRRVVAQPSGYVRRGEPLRGSTRNLNEAVPNRAYLGNMGTLGTGEMRGSYLGSSTSPVKKVHRGNVAVERSPPLGVVNEFGGER